jgi:hypothetical protein
VGGDGYKRIAALRSARQLLKRLARLDLLVID